MFELKQNYFFISTDFCQDSGNSISHGISSLITVQIHLFWSIKDKTETGRF